MDLNPSPTACLAVALARFAAPSATAQCVHQESGGVVMIDVESVPTTSSWVEETAVGGFSGSSYYRWNGPDHFGNPGNGILTYDFEIFSPGTYDVSLRNHHDHPDPTLQNDVWVRLDGGTWIKLFSPIANTWSFYTVFGLETGSAPAEYFLSAGVHQLQLSARSFNFRMDRLHLSQTSNPSPFQPQSPCAGASPGTPFCFGVSCPCGNDDPVAGCTNSSGAGATLTATGTTSYAADDLTLTAAGLPANNSALFFMGELSFAPIDVGDGLACTGGLFRFLPSAVSATGELVLANPIANAPPGLMGSGVTRYFQAWSRDVLCGPPPAPCPSPCANGSNLSHGLEVLFTP